MDRQEPTNKRMMIQDRISHLKLPDHGTSRAWDNLILRAPIGMDYNQAFPKGTMELISSAHTGYKCDLDEVITFIVRLSQLFQDDKEYDWSIGATMSATYILAAELLNKGLITETRRMIFFGAFLHECMSRGHKEVNYWLNRICRGADNVRDRLDGRKRKIYIKLLFSKFSYLHRAIARTQTRKAMSSFITRMIPVFMVPKAKRMHQAIAFIRYIWLGSREDDKDQVGSQWQGILTACL